MKNNVHKKYNKSNKNSKNMSKYMCPGNLGLLFTRRYFDELTKHLVEKVDRNSERDKYKIQQKLQSAYYKERNDNIISQAKYFEKPYGVKTEDANDIFPLELTTSYPGLLTGVGIIHSTGHMGETKLGLMFDHTTGLPYLPGSTVKGLIRSMFPLRDLEVARKCIAKAKKDKVNKVELLRKAEALKKQAQEKRSFITEHVNDKGFTEKSVDALERSIFDGEEIDQKTGKVYFVSQRDVFFDAFPIDAGEHGLLGIDYITPHKREFSNPMPIQFLRIEPEVKFHFEFRLKDSKLHGKIFSKEDKLNLFKEILTTIGIGAKTNVGYGQLKEDKNK